MSQQVLESNRKQNSPAAIEHTRMLEAGTAEHETNMQITTMLAFLDEIGIAWRYGTVPENTFLPGLEVVTGEIVIDKIKLRYPGDILHEAGHIALLPPEKRNQFTGNLAAAFPENEGDEMAVILWTCAVCLHLNLPLDFVIHDTGYKGFANWLRNQFESGTYVGLPLLVWMGLCKYPEKAESSESDGFPKMDKWVRS